MKLFPTPTKVGLAVVTLAAAGLAFGCAATPAPRELRDARTAYQQAASDPSAVKVQADIAEAKRALVRAETAFAEDPKSTATRDWSYIAVRRAASARAKANALTAIEDGKMAKTELKGLQAQQVAELAKTRGQLANAGVAISSERRARADAEQKTRDALATIAGMSAVQSDRGLVLTLSGSVLFATGKSVLLPSAQDRLREAAHALKDDGRSITIVGHTDSTGSDEVNSALSQKRADAVRAYIVANGVPSDRVKTEGAGATQPVADNATPEGRANNRRVEIVLENGRP